MTDETRPPQAPATGSEAWPTSGVGSRAATTPILEPAPKRALASLGFVMDSIRRRRSGRMILWSLVLLLALSGVSLLTYPFATNIWADRIQSNLESDYRAIGRQVSTGTVDRKTGSPLTKLSIPRLGVKNLIVVEGITPNALRAGAGHYPKTALPGDPTGNVAIAGHRTGFGSPFRYLERLRVGDKVYLDTPIGRHVYQVIPRFDGHNNPWVTHAKDWTVINPTPEASLTLTTCDPPGTSDNRLIARARLVRTDAKG